MKEPLTLYTPDNHILKWINVYIYMKRGSQSPRTGSLQRGWVNMRPYRTSRKTREPDHIYYPRVNKTEPIHTETTFACHTCTIIYSLFWEFSVNLFKFSLLETFFFIIVLLLHLLNTTCHSASSLPEDHLVSRLHRSDINMSSPRKGSSMPTTLIFVKCALKMKIQTLKLNVILLTAHRCIHVSRHF